jgi:hypothetical protein
LIYHQLGIIDEKWRSSFRQNYFPLDPSRFGYESHIKVLQSIATLKKEVVDPVSGKSYITATVNFLGTE